jgi:50S ribosomal protein uL3
MPLKTYNPTTPGQRGMTTQDFDSITTKKPLRSLLVIKRRGNGRNNQGRITTRHKGGGTKKFYRLVNFKLADGITAEIEHIEYDPNRSARIARIKEPTGIYHYILAAHGMKVGQKISSGQEVAIETGNRLPLKNIPIGSTVHATGLTKGKGWAGTIRRHNFHRGRKTHGGRSYRRPGSIGSMYPQHIFKGTRMAGQLGHDQVTIKNLKVALIDTEQNVIGVSGAVPGPRKGIVILKEAK